MKFKAMTAAIVVSMLGAGVAQANIIEDIYTGNVNFSSTTFTAMFGYNDQVGSVSPTQVTTGVEDPTILAKIYRSAMRQALIFR